MSRTSRSSKRTLCPRSQEAIDSRKAAGRAGSFGRKSIRTAALLFSDCKYHHIHDSSKIRQIRKSASISRKRPIYEPLFISAPCGCRLQLGSHGELCGKTCADTRLTGLPQVLSVANMVTRKLATTSKHRSGSKSRIVATGMSETTPWAVILNPA